MGQARGRVPFSDADVIEGVDVVLLVKQTGALLGSWTRNAVDLEVVSVMTATFFGSIETIMQAMRGETPETLRVTAEECQIVAVRLESRSLLVLIGSAAIGEGAFRRAAQDLAAKLEGPPPFRGQGPKEIAPSLTRRPPDSKASARRQT